jgi:tetratricopeptide (TPR) repeat protein
MKKLAAFFTLLTLLLSQTGFATESRLSLTASDGTGLELHQFEARVVLDGFLAFTELEMVFYNPENRRREGRFQIILPDNAAISRFAMKIGEHLQEGEIVETQLARRAYEDFLHRRQDPALLETDSGNRFNARIFPIEPKSKKRLILSYSQRLAGLESEYVLPLKGLPLLKHLAIKVFYDSDSFSTTQLGELTGTVSKREVLTIDKRNYQPTVDFRMPYQQKSPQPGISMQSEQLVAARIIPFTEATSTTAKQGLDNLIILMDTSASQAPYLADSLKRLDTLLPQLKVGTLQLYTFDQNINKVGTADNLTAHKALIGQLQQHKALGASRLEAAINALSALKLQKSRLLLISDTVVTAGETSAAALSQQLKTIPWLDRVDILIPSYHSDKQIARSLAKAGKSPGIVAPLALSNADIIRKLTHPVYADIPIKVSGSNWFWPEKVEALQTNEPLIVFAEMSSNPPITISVGDKVLSLTSKQANPILLKREWVRARLDKLLDMEDKTQDKDLKSAFHNEIINLSVKERVLSPYTSLLVLETEDDYRRYKIDRKGLADILTIGVDGLTVIKRASVETEQPTPEVATPDEDINKVVQRFIICILQERKAIETCLPENKETFVARLREDMEKQRPSEHDRQKIEEFLALIVQGNTEELFEYLSNRVPSSARLGERLEENASRSSVAESEADGSAETELQMATREDSAELETASAPPAPTLALRDALALSAPAPAPMAERPQAQTEERRVMAAPHRQERLMTRNRGAADDDEAERHAARMRHRAAQMRPHRDVPPPAPPTAALRAPARRATAPRSEQARPRTQRQEYRLRAAPPPQERMMRSRGAAADDDHAPEDEMAASRPAAAMASSPTRPRARRAEAAQEKSRQISPWLGKYAEFRALLEKADIKAAGNFAQQWHQKELANVMALIALGEWYEKTGDTAQAARAYGSLIDYFPARADIRRWAAERLLSINTESWLSIDSLKKAVEQRPDHPSGHYLLAIAYWEAGQYKKAVETLQAALERDYPRFAAAKRLLAETLALMLTRLEQQQQLGAIFPGNSFNWEKATQRQLRLLLMWETDANDVDFHIYDNQQHHAYYSQKRLSSGGSLYADITTGYGPECFSISEPKAFPYRIQAHYYNMGPMGYGMGVLHVLKYEPKTGLNSEFRPFVVMKDGAYVELGKVNE